MNIQKAIDDYKSLGEYFAPDYERDNEVLNDFKRNNPVLSKEQIIQFVDILENSNDITEKYFVADLLYLFDNFDVELLVPMLKAAINYKDPSFNRIFLRPCISAFGVEKVSWILAERFRKVDIEERLGISNLVYWLHPRNNGEDDCLRQAILEQAELTDNLIELYYYKLCYRDDIKDSDKLPNSASELVKAIEGNVEYEDLLFNKIGWTKVS